MGTADHGKTPTKAELKDFTNYVGLTITPHVQNYMEERGWSLDDIRLAVDSAQREYEVIEISEDKPGRYSVFIHPAGGLLLVNKSDNSVFHLSNRSKSQDGEKWAELFIGASRIEEARTKRWTNRKRLERLIQKPAREIKVKIGSKLKDGTDVIDNGTVFISDVGHYVIRNDVTFELVFFSDRTDSATKARSWLFDALEQNLRDQAIILIKTGQSYLSAETRDGLRAILSDLKEKEAEIRQDIKRIHSWPAEIDTTSPDIATPQTQGSIGSAQSIEGKNAQLSIAENRLKEGGLIPSNGQLSGFLGLADRILDVQLMVDDERRPSVAIQKARYAMLTEAFAPVAERLDA